MRGVRKSAEPATPTVPASRGRRLAWVAIGGAALALGIGAWLLADGTGHSHERLEALAAGYDQRPDAGELLTACFARDPNDIEVLETLVVWSLREKVPFARIEPHLDRLCELKPTEPAPWRTRGAQRIRNGRIEEGIADSLRALALDPDDHATRHVVATAALESGDTALALRELDRLIEVSSKHAKAASAMLVRAHLQASDPIRAEQVLERHFARRTDTESELLRGLVHQAAGRHEDAIAKLRTVADQPSEQRFAAFAALAKSLSALGRADDARKALDELDSLQARERAILDARQQPDSLPAQVRAAEAYLADGKPNDAAGLLERATAKLGHSPAAMVVLVRAYRQIGREDLAQSWERKSP